MVAGNDLVVAFAKLRLNLFSNQVDRRVKVVFVILRKQIRPLEVQIDGALKLVCGQTNMIPLKVNPCLQGSLVHVFEFIDANLDMFLDCIGDFNIVGIEN